MQLLMSIWQSVRIKLNIILFQWKSCHHIQINIQTVCDSNKFEIMQLVLFGKQQQRGNRRDCENLQQAQEGGNIFADNDLLRHNLVVMRGGENALQTLPPFVEIIPASKLNLIIYNLKNYDILEAFNLAKDLQPDSPKEYILKQLYMLLKGNQMQNQNKQQKLQVFQDVGSNKKECNTIQAGSTQLHSSFYKNNLRMSWSTQNQQRIISQMITTLIEIIEYLVLELEIIRKLKKTLLQYELRIIEMNVIQMDNKNFHYEWKTKEQYLNMNPSSLSFQILKLIANDCCNKGHKYYAAKTFDILAKLDLDHDYEASLYGFSILNGYNILSNLRLIVKVMNLLTTLGKNPQVKDIIAAIKKWGKQKQLENLINYNYFNYYDQS